MPRLVKYAFSRSSRPTTWEVGPPWAQTMYGGSSPSGATASGCVGGYTSACTLRPYWPSSRTWFGTGRYAGVGSLLGLPAQHLGLPGGRVDPDHRQRDLRAAGHRDDRVPVRGHARHELLERQVEVGELAGLRVEQPQPHAALAVQDGEPPVAEHRVRPPAQLPQRLGELLLGRVQRLRRLADQADLVHVPPAGPVGDHVQAGLVAPHRRQHRLSHPALNQPPAPQHPLGNLGHPQFGPIPGHPRVVPADPGQPAPIW